MVVTGKPAAPRRGADRRDHARRVAISQDERFIVLRRKTGRAALLSSLLLMAWYFLFVLATVFARGLMRHRLAGAVDVGLVFAALQFAATFALARRYVRRSREVLDPLRAQVVADAEHRTGAGR